jgi:hypothetical protein
LFYLGITVLYSGGNKARIERRETIFSKRRVEMIIWHTVYNPVNKTPGKRRERDMLGIVLMSYNKNMKGISR